MRLKSIELTLFKPLMHNGVRHVKVDDLPSVVVIAGENGSGKSSLLRECTPYPACRTDYEKNGLKRVEYEHGGSLYILISDFSKAAGAHSFVKDGLELNESGTTEVQEDLVETYFDYNDVVEKLMSGKYKICDMGKPDRKTLIMSTYPSSLSFMLDYYKVIASKVRALYTNIKMLSQREMSLKGQLISPTILNDYKQERDDLNKALSTIDVDIYTINKAIEEVTKTLESVSSYILQQTPDTFLGKLKGIQNRLKGLTKVDRNLPKSSEIKIAIDRLNQLRTSLDNKIREDNNAALAIRAEMDKFEKYLNTDADANIKECKNMIEVQDSIIKNTPLEKDVPILSATEVEHLRNNYTEILETLLSLKGATTPYWGEEQYKNIEIQMNSLQHTITQCNNGLVRVQEAIQMLELKKAKYNKTSWPADCKRVCPLRDSMADIVKSVDAQLETYKKERDTQTEDRAKMTAQYDELKKSLESRSPQREILNDLVRYFSTVAWGDYVLNGNPCIKALNLDLTKIYNNISKLLTNAENALKVKEATELKRSLESKLLNLQSESSPAEQLIKDSLAKREVQLQELVNSINASKAKIIELETKKYNNDIYLNLIAETERLNSDYSIWKKTYALQQEIKEWRRYIDDVVQSKMKIQNKLRELDAIIKEQDSYLIRLNDEVLVNLQEFQKQYDELSVIETQLSPTKGIPHLYTVKYLNSVFALANKYIHRVWSYDMEFNYITESDETFDYSFPVSLNNNSEIKDCNIGSNGQKSILNLALRLAICIFRQYTFTYPLIMDECTTGLSTSHSSNLVMFLRELLQQDNQIMQLFIVDHNVSISSSFASVSKMINLSKDQEYGSEWVQIGTIE